MSRHARHMVAIWSIDHLLTLTVAAVYDLKRPEVEEDRRTDDEVSCGLQPMQPTYGLPRRKWT